MILNYYVAMNTSALPRAAALDHVCLLRQYARVQARCTAQITAQAAQIERLEAQQMRLRMALMVSVTVAAWAQRDERLRGLLALTQSQALLCRSSCIAHGFSAREGDTCRRTGLPCVVDTP